MKCRPGCGACCIAISISTPLPGMPRGKPAGVRCVNLSDHNLCTIYNEENYPKVCGNLEPSHDTCGTSFDEAMENLSNLERLTQPYEH
jgi:Fe-S-cluster containining protein